MFEFQLPTFGPHHYNNNHSVYGSNNMGGGVGVGAGGNVYSSSMSSGGQPINQMSSYGMQNMNPPLTLEVENDLPSVLQFPIGINDIGGTLVVELSVNNGRVSAINIFLPLAERSRRGRFCRVIRALWGRQ